MIVMLIGNKKVYCKKIVKVIMNFRCLDVEKINF